MEFQNFFAGENKVNTNDPNEQEANAVKLIIEQSLKMHDLRNEWDTEPVLAVMIEPPQTALEAALAEAGAPEVPDDKVVRGVALVTVPVGDLTEGRRAPDAIQEFANFLRELDFPFRQDEVVGVMFGSEAWTLKIDDENQPDAIERHNLAESHRLNEHPEVEEVMMYAAVLMSGWSVFGVLRRKTREVFTEVTPPFGGEIRFDGAVHEALSNVLDSIRLRAAHA